METIEKTATIDELIALGREKLEQERAAAREAQEKKEQERIDMQEAYICCVERVLDAALPPELVDCVDVQDLESRSGNHDVYLRLPGYSVMIRFSLAVWPKWAGREPNYTGAIGGFFFLPAVKVTQPAIYEGDFYPGMVELLTHGLETQDLAVALALAEEIEQEYGRELVRMRAENERAEKQYRDRLALAESEQGVSTETPPPPEVTPEERLLAALAEIVNLLVDARMEDRHGSTSA